MIFRIFSNVCRLSLSQPHCRLYFIWLQLSVWREDKKKCCRRESEQCKLLFTYSRTNGDDDEETKRCKKRVYTMRERIIIQDWPDWWSQFRHDELARFKFNQIKPHIRAWISYLPTLSLSLFNLLKNCSRLYNEAWNQIKVSKVVVSVHDDGCQNWSDSAARHTRWLHIFFLSYFYRDTG